MLFVSPLSPEIVEAAYIMASRGYPMGFCASVNQVGPGAYTGFEYEVFARLRHSMERRYRSKVFLERDHLGRKGEKFDEWIPRDMDHGFDGFMLHVHSATEKDCMTALNTYKTVFQVGPGEDDSKRLDPMIWAHTHDLCQWVSFPNGCKIQGLGNSNEFDHVGTAGMRGWYPNLKIRGHNCDYLVPACMKKVMHYCHGWNIAPQIGVVQSQVYYQHLKTRDWEFACVFDKARLDQWSLSVTQWLGIGHYHFDKLDDKRSVSDLVIGELLNFMRRNSLVQDHE